MGGSKLFTESKNIVPIPRYRDFKIAITLAAKILVAKNLVAKILVRKFWSIATLTFGRENFGPLANVNNFKEEFCGQIAYRMLKF